MVSTSNGIKNHGHSLTRTFLNSRLSSVWLVALTGCGAGSSGRYRRLLCHDDNIVRNRVSALTQPWSAIYLCPLPNARDYRRFVGSFWPFLALASETLKSAQFLLRKRKEGEGNAARSFDYDRRLFFVGPAHLGVLGQSQQEFCAHSDCRMD